MTMGDRIAIMHQGRIQQVAPPLEIYRNPANRFVAAFIGSPPMNFLPVTVRANQLTHAAFSIALPTHWQSAIAPLPGWQHLTAWHSPRTYQHRPVPWLICRYSHPNRSTRQRNLRNGPDRSRPASHQPVSSRPPSHPFKSASVPISPSNPAARCKSAFQLTKFTYSTPLLKPPWSYAKKKLNKARKCLIPHPPYWG